MLEDIGKILKEEREKQGKSLSDVHNATKISIHNLKAIEEGDLESLPHPVYVKGFIKNYADFLGLDGYELSKKFIEEHELFDKNLKEDVKYVDEPSDRKPVLAIVLSTLLIIILFVAAYVALKFRTSEMITPVVPANEKKREKSEPKSVTPLKKEISKKESPSRKQYQEKTAPMSEKRTNKVKSNPNISEEKEVKKTERQSPQKKEIPTGRFHSLKISAFEPCWLKAEVDGQVKEFYLRKGEFLTLKFKEKLNVKLGNAGGVQLEYDGQVVPLKAKSGEVRIVGFP